MEDSNKASKCHTAPKEHTALVFIHKKLMETLTSFNFAFTYFTKQMQTDGYKMKIPDKLGYAHKMKTICFNYSVSLFTGVIIKMAVKECCLH